MSGELAGQVAVVSGSGSGFGRAIAMALAREGASVVVSARSQDRIDAVAEEIVAAGGRAIAVRCDVTERHEVENLRDVTQRKYGTATYVIHCAGVGWPIGPTWHVDPDQWWAANEVHVRGGLYLIHSFVPEMIERGGGRVAL